MLTLPRLLSAVTARAILRALRLSHGSREGAAKLLGIPLRTFHYQLAKHVDPCALEEAAARYGWPTRAILAAHAREARPKAQKASKRKGTPGEGATIPGGV